MGYIYDMLKPLRRSDLSDILLIFGADKVCRKEKRGDLLLRAAQHLTHKPEVWLNYMFERDLRLLRLLVSEPAGKKVYLEYPDYPSILETINLIHSDNSEPDFRKLWIDGEFADIVMPYLENAIAKGEKSCRFEVERLASGILNIYGILPYDEYIEKILNLYYEEKPYYSEKQLTEALFQSPLNKVYLNGGLMLSPYLYDLEKTLAEIDKYPEVSSFKNITYREALEAGKDAPYCVLRREIPEGVVAEKMLSDLGYNNAEILMLLHDIWYNAQYANDRECTEAIFLPVTRKQDEIESFEEYDDCMQKLADYANALPKWILKGHSAKEVGVMQISIRVENGTSPLYSLAVPHVEMNAPCPCGSGLSYKNCHGKFMN